MIYQRVKVLVLLIGVGFFSLAEVQSNTQNELPTHNPVSNYDIPWTGNFQWQRVISIDDAEGQTVDEKLDWAQRQLMAEGGGVVFFPEGKYHFTEHVLLKSGIVIRGTEPLNSEKHNPVVPHEFPAAFIDAREPRYTLGTEFVFPRYQPVLEGNGSSNETAFKGIRLEDPGNASYCGVVNIHIHNGHVALGTADALQENYAAGKMTGQMLVFGNILHSTAVPMRNVPADFQQG
jgi:hypothetical protein